MAIIPVRGLGTKGINRDTAPVLLTPDTWSNGRNVRFDNGSAEKIAGHRAILTTIVEPIAVRYWDYDDSYIYADAQNIYRVTANNTSTEISSRTITYDSEGRWQFSLFNGGYTFIINNTRQVPQFFTTR